ncbi:MAG: hypothetical protein Q7T44_17510 [Parvibaculum sp.]|nr:hypothetical protein [Parvibaculum sp.]
MKKIIFIADESGAKGYSSTQENQPGELGVMAGYLIPESCLDSVKQDFDCIRSKFFSAGKVHITDLTASQQNEMRKEFFEYFLERKIFWVYEATYVQGYAESALRLNELTKGAHQARRSEVSMSWREKHEMLHGTLFQGAFGKAVAFCMDMADVPFQIDVITDRTDDPILKLFHEKASELLSVGEDSTHEATGFDRASKEVVRGKISISVGDPDNLLGDFSQVSFTIVCDDSALTLAADVLANSVNYHLNQLQEESPGIALNRTRSMSEHPLQSLLYGGAEDDGIDISDALYRHPMRVQ